MQNHGLDVPRAVIITAERTIGRILDYLPSSVKGQLLDPDKRRSPRKMLLERSMDWMVVKSETYAAAPT